MYEKIKPLLSAEEVRRSLPADGSLLQLKNEVVRGITDILFGRDKRKLMIVGPCSADDPDTVCDYASRLFRIADRIKDRALVIMRVYTSKPRTRGEGYMGMLHTPDPVSGETDIAKGILAMRKTHLRVIKESGLFTADEMLYPDAIEYVSDILSYVTVGARSAESQLHRFAASGLDMPVGIKNPINGNLAELLNSIHAVRLPNEFMFCGMQVRTNGNSAAHAVLRGAVDMYGNNIPNYGYDEIMRFYELCVQNRWDSPSVIVDTGHSNSGKDPSRAAEIADDVLDGMRRSETFNGFVKGFMIESYIEDGCRKTDGGAYGRSITDPCLSVEKTEKLLLKIAENVIM